MAKIKLGGRGFGGFQAASNFVCFSCRLSKKDRFDANCHGCGKPMINLGKKYKVPPKHKIKEWKDKESSVMRAIARRNPQPPVISTLKGKTPVSEEIKEVGRIKKYKGKKREPLKDE
jgi:hypothetical protein